MTQEELMRGIQRLAANGNDEKGGERTISALIHQTGMTLSQRGQNLLPASLQVDYANRVHRPALTTIAILPAISYFLRVNDGSIGLTLTQKLVTTGYTAVVTPGRGTCGAAGRKRDVSREVLSAITAALGVKLKLQRAVGSTYWTNQGNVRRGIALWWKTRLRCRIIVFIFCMVSRSEDQEESCPNTLTYRSEAMRRTREVLQWAKKWTKKGPVNI